MIAAAGEVIHPRFIKIRERHYSSKKFIENEKNMKRIITNLFLFLKGSRKKDLFSGRTT